MKNIIYVLLALSLCSMVYACKPARKSKNYNDVVAADSAAIFLKEAVAVGNAQVKYSSIALQNSKNSNVRAIAKMVIADHAELGTQLHKLASKKDVNVNGPIDTVEEKHIKSLSAKKGVLFDKEYVQLVVTDHEQAVNLYNAALNNPNAAISDLAAKFIPKLKEHLTKANAICQSEGLK